jgi:hypothetical protein
MPGYAYPVDAVASAGTAKSISFLVTDKVSSTATLIYTATSKTKVNSIVAVHTGGDTGILPVNVYVGRDISGTVTKYLIAKNRVLKNSFMVLPIVSGDSRVGEDGNPISSGYNKVLPEFVLNTGDKLYATCPFEDIITLHIDLSEGIK